MATLTKWYLESYQKPILQVLFGKNILYKNCCVPTLKWHKVLLAGPTAHRKRVNWNKIFKLKLAIGELFVNFLNEYSFENIRCCQNLRFKHWSMKYVNWNGDEIKCFLNANSVRNLCVICTIPIIVGNKKYVFTTRNVFILHIVYDNLQHG